VDYVADIPWASCAGRSSPTLHHCIVDDSHPPGQREWLNRMYGNGLKSMWTVIQMTFANWVGAVVENVNAWFAGIITVYGIALSSQ